MLKVPIVERKKLILKKFEFYICRKAEISSTFFLMNEVS